MKANNFIRALVSAGFGALVYFAITVNSSSHAADELQAKVETQKTVVMAKAPHAVREATTKTKERFVPAPPAPVQQPAPIVEARVLDSERNENLKSSTKEAARQTKVALDKAKKEAEQRAKEKAELAKKVTEAFVADKERKERDRKKKEAAAAKKERRALKGVPVPGAVIGAGFGLRGPWARYHTGLDFRASYGTTIKAVAPGKIIYAGNKGDWAGNHVVIRHSDGKKTLYAHMSSISRHGGSVQAGDEIGKVGRSGRAFGAHLHLELYPAGVQPGDVYSAVNPRPWLKSHGIG